MVFETNRDVGSCLEFLKKQGIKVENYYSEFLYSSPFHTRREFLRIILYRNIAIIAIQHGNFILLTPLTIFPILLSEIHSSPSGKFPYTYQLKLPMWRIVITIEYGKNRHTVY